MKKILFTLSLIFAITCQAENGNNEHHQINEPGADVTQRIETISNENKSLIKENILLSKSIDRLAADNASLKNFVSKQQEEINALKSQVASNDAKTDSIGNTLLLASISNAELANTNHAAATQRIQTVETDSINNIRNLALWVFTAFALLLVAAIIVYFIIHRGINKNNNTFDSIRETQNHIIEESVKLDTKLVGILGNQMITGQSRQLKSDSTDHSLALKIADEVTRIEMNLSRMDTSIRGYKQLSKAIERIKDNFQANGYDIVTYVGKPYSEGMRINADFIIDEKLPEGTRKITSVSKPQVLHKGILIQKATVTVAQNI